ncbi:MAG: glycosyl hydrolase 53 family protein [Bdellovibrionales bacterium]|nr:glycosyl hydrolase 53 family protein [Bdellovibrionales bacterium]
MSFSKSFSTMASLLLIIGCTGGHFSVPNVASSSGNQSLGSVGGSTPTPTPSVSPTATPLPGASVTPTPTMTPTPTPKASPVNQNIVLGVNGHDGRQYYPLTQSENLFKLLDSKNLRSYRVDADPRNFTLLDEMVRLQKKYNVNVRPMVYPLTKADGYTLAKKYGADIKIWEIGNEQDYSKTGAQDRINAMVTMYQGMKQASDELGLNLKFTINVMACNSDDTSATARCPNDKNGAMWFLDMAKASGFNFDYISFHYYAYLSDKGYWYDMYFGQMRAMATKYKTKIFYNEVNCADIYQGNTDGGKAGDKACYDSMKQLLTEVNANHKDIIQEINMYELLDEPNNDGVEAHFGLMYDLTKPKELFNLITSFAK